MNALHLLWIVPLSTLFGFLLCAILSVNGDEKDGEK